MRRSITAMSQRMLCKKNPKLIVQYELTCGFHESTFKVHFDKNLVFYLRNDSKRIRMILGWLCIHSHENAHLIKRIPSSVHKSLKY